MRNPVLARHLCPALVLLLLVPAAQASASADGHWEGAIETPGGSLAIVVDLQQQGGSWQGVIDIPQQGLTDFPLADITVEGSAVGFALAGVPGDPKFSGELDGGGQAISGTFAQGGMSLSFALQRAGEAEIASATAAAAVPAATRELLTGTWSGSLEIPGRSMRLIFHVTAEGDALAATMDSPDEGQSGLPVSRVEVDDRTVRFVLSYANAVWEGVLGDVAGRMDGTWSQGGGSLPLVLEQQGRKAASSSTVPAPARSVMRSSEPTAPASGMVFPEASPASQGLEPRAVQRLTEHLQGLVDSEEIVGGEIAVIKNRRKVLHEAFGWKDREAGVRLEPGALHCVRSMTKPLVGTAVAMLLEEGALSLDTRVADIIPEFDHGRAGDITVEHLLTHSSGLPFTTIAQPLTSYGSILDVAREAARRGPDFVPGSDFQYSDAGSDTLGALVAHVSGMPVHELVTQRILQPLGMNDSRTLLKAGSSELARVPTAYSGGTGNWQPHWSPEAGPLFPLYLTSQSLYSTVDDYARFLALWMDGGRSGGRLLLTDDSVASALTPAFLMPGGPTGFSDLVAGYGWQWVVYPPAAHGLSGRPAVFGHSGSDGTHAWAWPEHDLMVLFFTQSRGTTVGLRLEELLHATLVEGRVDEVEETVLSEDALAEYLGSYWDDNNRHRLAEVTRVGRTIAFERPDKAQVVLKATATPDRFVHEATDRFSIEFGRDAQGNVRGFELVAGDERGWCQRAVPEHGLPSAKRLMRRVRKGHHSMYLDGIGSIRMTGRVEIEAQGLSGTIETVFDAERQRSDMNLGAISESSATDGRGAWVKSSASPVQQLEGAPLEQALSERIGVRLSGHWDEHYEDVTVMRRTDIGDRQVFVVRCRTQSGRMTTKHVDARTGLVLLESRLVMVPGMGLIGTDVRHGDFREVRGVKLPFRTRVKYAHPLIGTIDIRTDRAEAGGRLSDELFATPE
ncbi:MAG: serine hydrolase domain-containing protein [Acidobacteriota bacterium]